MDLALTMLLFKEENKEKLQISNYYILKKQDFFVWWLMELRHASTSTRHAPDSTGSFILSYHGQSIVTNGGVSTYEKNKIRNFERSRYVIANP